MADQLNPFWLAKGIQTSSTRTIQFEYRCGREANIVKDWNDLRFFLSVARLGSLSAASRSLRVDPATVGRRIKSLETALSLRCFERRADGYRLTETADGSWSMRNGSRETFSDCPAPWMRRTG